MSLAGLGFGGPYKKLCTLEVSVAGAPTVPLTALLSTELGVPLCLTLMASWCRNGGSKFGLRV